MALGEIDWLLGTWEGEVEMAASPWVEAGTAAARLSFAPALDGKGIVQEYTHRGDTSTMDGHGVFMAGDDGLLWWWFDSFGFPPPAPAAGRIDEGGALVLERSSPRGTNRTTFRREGDVLHQRNEVLLPDAQDFVTVVEGRYQPALSDDRSTLGRQGRGRFDSKAIRDATAEDWPAIWPIFAQIVRAADTFSYDPAIGEDAAREMWMVRPPGRTTVGVDDDGTIVGTANMFANRPGPGDHVASGNYMVAAGRRGEGIGRALVEDSVRWAREAGFRAMQFNAVTESNTPAVQLYERVGFVTVGRVPGAFRHPELGEVALLVMHRPL